jgi:hypothetical protein
MGLLLTTGTHRLLLIALLTFLCVSCSTGPTLIPIQGKALFKNQPIEGVTLTFHPKSADINTIRPVGFTAADGTFSLKTGESVGAPPGEYTVTAICFGQAAPKEQKGMSMQRFTPEDRFKGAYANEATSRIKVEIKEGMKELEPINFP